MQKNVDSSLQNFHYKNRYSDQITQLKNLRKNIYNLSATVNFEFHFFTKLIQKLQENYIIIVQEVNEPSLKNMLISYIDIAFSKEALGRMRASVNALLSEHINNKKLRDITLLAKGNYDISLQRSQATLNRRYHKQLKKILHSNNYQYIQKVLYNIIEKSIYTNNSQEWFLKSTNIIEQFYSLEENHFSDINKKIQEDFTQKRILFVIILLIFFFVTISTLLFGLYIKKNILKNMKLLKEYKNAVDRSSIVSKTDKYGRITYANDKFCKISGYTQEELIGKAHSIVRHPDMPKSAFKEVWDTILAKKSWYGIVKNRKKDGSDYTVEVTINPIINENGEIEEFIAIRNDITELMRLYKELEDSQEDFIYRMGEIAESRSKETGLHVRRVAKYSELLAKHYGLTEQEIKDLTSASPMHDIGKVGIPDNVLNKPGKLTEEELVIMRQHSTIGYNLFKDSNKPLLQAAATIAYEHHEKYDGSGFPRGIKGEEIHIYGRITALADVFDALGTERCYKKAWEDEKIFELLKAERGKHFDPQLVDIFFEHLDEFLAIRDLYKESNTLIEKKS
ncbi:RESPONSE REGULATOR PROTEIN-CheY-like nd an HD-GYP domain [hydrothermal vent metagenome]|uniref:RESPONSE REGULATOR PROTEIN-CheY-like nd an HD-GYP domain n=1 Tax=hydrothermal vent metagenome TaxID=652676 RepID=A0A1W1CHG8_9ZZZZ